MAAEEPLIEQIAAKLEEILRGVTITAGYQTAVGDVIRPDRQGNFRALKHLEVAMVQDDSRAAEAQPIGGEDWLTDFIIELRLCPSDNDATPFDTLCNRAGADLRKALMVDRKLGGALGVLDLTVGPAGKVFAIDNAGSGIQLTVTVEHRHKLGDPYTLLGE